LHEVFQGHATIVDGIGDKALWVLGKVGIHTRNPVTNLQLLMPGICPYMLKTLGFLWSEQHSIHKTQLHLGTVPGGKGRTCPDIATNGDQRGTHFFEGATKALTISKSRQIGKAIMRDKEDALARSSAIPETERRQDLAEKLGSRQTLASFRE